MVEGQARANSLWVSFAPLLPPLTHLLASTPSTLYQTMPRDPTNAQISSRLSYRSGPTPDFLRALQSRVAGRSPSPPSDEPEPSYDDYAAYQDDANGGRPPIPRRPPPPRRPKDQAGSGDEDEFGRKRRGEEGEGDDGEKLDEEDGEDERPQVVVLKEGKHLSQVEAENERRKGTFRWVVSAIFSLALTDLHSQRAASAT